MIHQISNRRIDDDMLEGRRHDVHRLMQLFKSNPVSRMSNDQLSATVEVLERALGRRR